MVSQLKSNPNNDAGGQPSHAKRTALLVMAIGLLGWGAIGEATADRLGQSVSNAAVIRVGMILLAVWIAFPLLSRPATWLPPGSMAVALILIGATVTQPKLLIVLIPLFSALLGVGAAIRYFRRLTK